MRPEVDIYRTPVRAAAPQAIGIARALARLFGAEDLRGAGTVRYGEPAPGTRHKYAGYANTPQLFIGYSPLKVAAGTVRNQPGALPSTSAPTTVLNSPLQRSLLIVANGQGGPVNAY